MKEGYSGHNGQGKVGIIGLGFVGLPLSMAFLHSGFDIIGVDYDHNKITALRSGQSYVQDIQDDAVAKAIASGRLHVTTDYSALVDATTVIICVPTPLSTGNSPDLSFLINTCEQLYPLLRPGQLIVIESSTYPGTTREIVQPILEKSGLTIGRQLFLAYSPERIDPGNNRLALNEIPKVVSGITVSCKDLVHQLYEQVFLHVVTVSSPEVAETTKLLENTFRFINISFINEFAQLCDTIGVNVWEVIHAASTKPYGFSAFYPGPGIGGHCIPVDPLYLQWKAEQLGSSSRFITLAQEINESMPSYIADKLQSHLPNGKPLSEAAILIYGVTYKKNIADLRESAALPIIHTLLERGAAVSYHDPLAHSLRLEHGTELQSVALTEDRLQQADCVLICTDHDQMPASFIAEHSRFIFDTRNTLTASNGKAKLVGLGSGIKGS